MSKVKITKSNLKGSPIILDSPKAKVDIKENRPISSQKNKMNMFNNPWTITIVGGVIVGIILLIIGGNNMSEPKVNIEDSSLNKSPVVVDSPGAIVGENININQERPDRHITLELISDLENYLPTDKSKEIIFGVPPASKPEVHNFASEIRNQLRSEGRKVGGISYVGNFPSFEGDLSFKDFGGVFEIYVNNK